MHLSSHVPSGRRATALLLAGLTAASLALSGCSSSGSGNGSGKSAGLSAAQLAAAKASAAQAAKPPTQITETTPLSKTPPTGKLIFFVGDQVGPDAEAYAGIQGAAKLLGWKTKQLKFDASNLSTYNTGLLQALSQHPDYMVDSGIAESQISKSTLAAYKSANVPIIAYNVTPITQVKPFVSLYGGKDAFEGAGVKLANWFIADSKGRGKVLNVNVTAYPILKAHADAFDGEVKAKCPSCSTTRLSETFANFVKGGIASDVVSKLRADRSIKYVEFDSSLEIAGLDTALKAAGINDVKLLGFGIESTTVKSLRSGAAKAFVAYNFRYNGWASVDAAARMSVGDPAVNPKSVTPTWLITSANVNQVPANALYRGPNDALAQFAKLWHVSAS